MDQISVFISFDIWREFIAQKQNYASGQKMYLNPQLYRSLFDLRTYTYNRRWRWEGTGNSGREKGYFNSRHLSRVQNSLVWFRTCGAFKTERFQLTRIQRQDNKF